MLFPLGTSSALVDFTYEHGRLYIHLRQGARAFWLTDDEMETLLDNLQRQGVISDMDNEPVSVPLSSFIYSLSNVIDSFSRMVEDEPEDSVYHQWMDHRARLYTFLTGFLGCSLLGIGPDSVRDDGRCASRWQDSVLSLVRQAAETAAGVGAMVQACEKEGTHPEDRTEVEQGFCSVLNLLHNACWQAMRWGSTYLDREPAEPADGWSGDDMEGELEYDEDSGVDNAPADRQRTND